jgi:uncharacterized protein
MKCIVSFFVFLIGLLSSTIFANLNPLTLVPLNNRVVDYSNTLDQWTLAQLNEKAKQVQEQTQTQIAVALIPHREGNELIDIGLKLFRESKLWSAEKNNGLLLLISTQEKKLRIIVGYGLEGDLPDVLIKQIIEEDIRPLINQWDFWWAIAKYFEAIPTYIWADARGWLWQKSWNQDFFIFLFFGFFLGFFLGEMIEAIFLTNKKRRESESSRLQIIPKLFPYLLPFWAIIFLLSVTGIGYQIRLGIGTILGGIFAYFTDVNHPRRENQSGGYRWGRSSGGFWWGFWWGGWFSGFGWSSWGWGAGD